MNLERLFEIQLELDAEIEKKHPTLPGEDRLAKRILALQVELGECANEWRGFKFWSTNQKPNNCVRTTKGATKENVIELFCSSCGDSTSKKHEWFEKILKDDYNKCLHCGEPQVNFMTEINPLLEEYVDCLHFILSIGLEISFTKYSSIGSYQKPETIEGMFLLITEEIAVFSKVRRQNPPIQYVHMYYSTIFEAVIALGEMLGFTWEQVEEAYLQKNQINHERQANGY